MTCPVCNDTGWNPDKVDACPRCAALSETDWLAAMRLASIPRRTRRNDQWTPSMDSMLLGRAEAGDTSVQIAEYISAATEIIVSRSAVLGRAHRMGVQIGGATPGAIKSIRRS